MNREDFKIFDNMASWLLKIVFFPCTFKILCVGRKPAGGKCYRPGGFFPGKTSAHCSGCRGGLDDAAADQAGCGGIALGLSGGVGWAVSVSGAAGPGERGKRRAGSCPALWKGIVVYAGGVSSAHHGAGNSRFRGAEPISIIPCIWKILRPIT